MPYFRQETFDRLCAALGQALIVGVAALGVGVAGDDKGAALQFAAGERISASNPMLRPCRAEQPGRREDH